MKFLKAYIQSYPQSILLVENKGFTQSKNNLPQILPFKTLMKGSSLIKFWEVTGNKGVILLLINIKCTVIVVDHGSPIRNMPHSTILIFYETNFIYPQYKT